MGRAPCCDKANVKRGPWSPEEDAKLKSYIDKNGTGGNWIALPQKIGLKRCGKSCRLRWLNYLRPNIKHGSFSEEEDNVICTLYMNIGSRWSIIAAQLPGRTDNDIKNYWNTRLKKKLLGKQRKEQQAARRANHAMIKQEMKRENIENSFNMMMAPPAAAMNLYSSSYYWPDLPSNVGPMSVVNPGQEPHIKDQESLKNLLVKLGGKFSNDQEQQNNLNPTNFQYYPFDIPSSQAQPFDQNSNINSPHDLPNTNGGDDFINFQEFNNWTIDQLNELLYSGTTHIDQYEGIGSFSGVEMVNGSSGTTTSTESTSWASTDHHHMNSFISPPPPMMIGNYENSRQGFLQDSSSLIEDPRYFGFQ